MAKSAGPDTPLDARTRLAVAAFSALFGLAGIGLLLTQSNTVPGLTGGLMCVAWAIGGLSVAVRGILAGREHRR